MLVEYPSSLAYEFVTDINIVAEFNDVRPTGSSPMEFYAIAGIQIHDPALSNPTGMHWQSEGVGPLNAPFGHSGTMLVNTSLESVIYQQFAVKNLEYMVDSYFHAHVPMVDDFWIIKGSPAQLGLLSPPWLGSFSNMMYGDGVMASMKAHLRRAMQASGAEIICTYKQFPMTEFVDGYTVPFTRRAFCPFAKGEHGSFEITFVCFFKAQQQLISEGSPLPALYGMHAGLRMSSVRLPGTANHIGDRCKTPAPHVTLESRGEDLTDEGLLSAFYGTFDCMIIAFRADGMEPMSWAALYPWLYVLFWWNALLSSAVLLLLGLGCGCCILRCKGSEKGTHPLL